MWHEKGGAENDNHSLPNWMNHRRAIMLNEILSVMMMGELLFDKTIAAKGPPSFVRRQGNQAPAIRILHVDDDPDVREVVEQSLGLQPDFVTRSCSSGKEALAIAPDWKPDLILLDLMMPDMGGVMTLARLRLDPNLRMPVVFMTGRRIAQGTEYFRSLGAAGVIFKSLGPMNLAASVRGYLQH
jgi:CheY-like chemotaxis protein